MSEISLQTTLAFAFVLGALHVLEPAHGRSIIHALLVGSSGRRSDVLKFGLAVMLSHLGVAAVLAAVAWFVGHDMGQHVLAPAFKIGGAALTVAIGILMLTCGFGQHTTCIHKHHGIEHQHDPHHEEEHAAHMLQATMINPTVLGVTGGLIPCQGTIALVTLSVSSGKLESAVYLLVSFALGLGLCLMAVGLLTTVAARKASALSDRLGSSRAMALAPGILVTLVGAVALAYSIMELSQPHVH